MIHCFIQGILVAAISLTVPHAFANNKRADEAGGGKVGGGSGEPKGGTNSAAGIKGAEIANGKATKEATGVIRNETKKKDQKVQQNNGK